MAYRIPPSVLKLPAPFDDAGEPVTPLVIPLTPPHADAAMPCNRATCAAMSGFYSVGVGPPRAAPANTASYRLSPSLSFLEQLSMEIDIVKGGSKSGRKQFAMTVHHRKTKASWRHCRSVEDYQRLQDRLLELMEQGHFCMAECPWLYTFLQRSFPKPPPLFSFGFMSDRVLLERRYALLRTLVTLQAVLLNPTNHSCSVLTEGVATEVVAFLYGEQATETHSKEAVTPTVATATSQETPHPWEVASPVGGAVLGFSASLCGSDAGDEDTPTRVTPTRVIESEAQAKKVCCSMCALKAHHGVEVAAQDEHVLATWRKLLKCHANKTRSSSVDTAVLSQSEDTPREDLLMTPRTPHTPPPFTPPPIIPENAVLSPPRGSRARTPGLKDSPSASKRFSLGATTATMLHALRHRVRSQPTSYAA